MKIKSIYYQRNGVGGNPFYTAYYNNPEYGEMVATFETTTTEEENPKEKILWRTCRVVCPGKPELAFRGDEIATELQRTINEMTKDSNAIYTIYDLSTTL